MRRLTPLCLMIAAAALLLLAPQGAQAQKFISGTISTDTTLDTVGGSIYVATGTLTVNSGVTLTIDPGVTVKFEIGRGITVNGRLHAVGGVAQADRIYLTSLRNDNVPPPLGDDTNLDGNSTVPANGDWLPITFNDSASDLSRLENCDISFGGRSSTGVIVCNDASPTIESCDLSAGYYGVRCNGASDPVLRNTSINAMTDVPVALEIEANPFFDNLVFGSSSDNGFDAIGLLGSTLTGANTLAIRGATLGPNPIDNFVYIILGDIIIDPAATLTIEEGIVAKPKNAIDVTVHGTLIMDGTALPDEQIVFTSFKDDNYGTPPDTNNDGSITSPAQSDWGVIEFLPGSTGSVSWSVLKFGGESLQGVLRSEDASPAIDNVVVSDCDYGIEQKGLSASNITNCDISNTDFTPFFLSVTATPTFSGNTFSNVGLAALGLISETIGVDATLDQRTVAGFANITYWLQGHLTMNVTTTLTVDPGVVIKFNKPGTYPRIIIGGALVADGTPVEPIYFSSQFDDDVGNPADTEGNGSATVPDDGQWGFVKFEDTSDDLTSVLDYCVFSYGGQDASFAYRGAVWCNSASPTITNNQFLTNETGIRTDGNSAPLIQDNNFFNNDEVPLATSVVSNPTYVGNTFDQNQYHVVGILAETLAQDATLEKLFVGGPPQFTDFFPYMHLGTLVIGTGSTLTVEAGNVVKMFNTTLPISVDGGLRMLGTAVDRIVYTSIKDDSKGGDSNVDGSSTSPASQNWSRIQFNSTTLDATSLLEHCLFRFGGSGSQGVVECESASPTIRDCEFEINRDGLWIQNASDPIVQNNLFRLSEVAPISKSVLANPTLGGNVYDNNAFDVLGLIGENIAQDLTVSQWNVAGYNNITRALVGSTLDVNFGSTLTIDPGVVLKMGVVNVTAVPFRYVITVGGALIADGTPADPIVFTSIRDDDYGNPGDSNNDGSLTLPQRYDWQDITFEDVSDDATTIMDNCVVRYGGWSGQVVRIQTASPTISDCLFETNWNYGIRIEGASNPPITGSTFGGHEITPIQMSLVSDPTFAGNTFLSTNKYSALGILGETLAADVTWKNRTVSGVTSIPYILTGHLTAGLSSILTIEPGVVIKPLSGIDIRLRRGIIAEGTPDAKGLIVFTSPQDDFYGGDTNNDAGATDGNGLRWGSIEIQNEVIDSQTRFSNCVFRYASSSVNEGAIKVTNANPQVASTIFSHNGVGINYIGAAGDPTKGQVNDCDFFANQHFAIKNTGLSFTVDATNNWWGDATGPFDPSDDTGTGGLYNPGGLGDPVTDLVDYSGWKTTGVDNVNLGDVSLNGEIRAYDASLILQELAALIVLTPLQELVADVNCSGAHSTLDASLILRLVSGLDTFFPCAYPKAQVMLAESYAGSEPGEFVVDMQTPTLAPGAQSSFAIDVSGRGELLGHQYRLAYDVDQMTIVDVRLLPAAAGAQLFWGTTEDGRLHIALASAELLPVAPAVEIVVEGAAGLEGSQIADISLELARLNEQDLLSPTPAEDTPTRQQFWLGQNHPNPFNPSTTIKYAVPGTGSESAHVRLVVYDLAGRQVRTLINEPQAAGVQSVIWDGRDATGRSVASGVYLYRLEAGPSKAVRKMLLVK